MESSRLMTFFRERFCLVERSEKRLTHLLMDGSNGGRVHVRPEDEGEFYDAYGKDIENSVPLYVIEKRSEVFKFHLDVDLTKMLSDGDVMRIAELAVDVTSSFHPEGPGASCVVCAPLAAPGARDRLSPGLHLIWTQSAVDEDRSLWMRSSIVHELRRLEGLAPDIDWAKAVDISVLTTSGLRMLGSDKCRPCSGCKGARDQRLLCGQCHRRGKIPEHRVYWPWATVPYNPRLLGELVGNPGHGARVCSIRLGPTARLDEHYRVPPRAPPPSLKRRFPSGEGKLLDRQYELGDHEVGGGGRSGGVQRTDLPEDLRASLLESIRGFHEVYDRVELRDLRQMKHRGGRSYIAKVSGIGSRFCLNKQDDHRSATVYFLLRPSGMTQRCYSRKEETRRGGVECSGFSSGLQPLPEALLRRLFPEAAEEQVEEQLDHHVVDRCKLAVSALPAAVRFLTDSELGRPSRASRERFDVAWSEAPFAEELMH